MPRPFDALVKKRYVALLDRGRLPRLAAEDVGFAWSTVQKHLKEDREFATACHDASMRLDEHVESVVLDLALDGNLAAAKMWFQGRQPGKYVEAQRPGQGGVGGGQAIQIAVVSTDALRQMLTGEQRGDMLELVKEIPAIAPIETTGTEAEGG